MAPAPHQGLARLTSPPPDDYLERTEPAELQSLIAPALLQPLARSDYERLARYMDLLYRWNARMNLTAVRDSAVFAQVHLAECLLAGQLVPKDAHSMLDFGAGAGLPGIPMAIARPELSVTLIESQGKKAAFLRESARQLQLKNVTVLHGRGGDLSSDAVFDLVALRAVDKMEEALPVACRRIASGGWCFVLTSASGRAAVETLLPRVNWLEPITMPRTSQRLIMRGQMGLPG